MKQELKVFCWLNLAIFIFLVYQSSDLIALLYDKPMTNGAISQKELLLKDPLMSPGHFTEYKEDGSPELIPRIIHQTYKTDDIPELWKEAQQSIKDQHPDYEYIMWTDEMARDFIASHYSWFLPTFDAYKHPIMRADAIRYFVLFHYGGIYIDLDNGTNQPLNPLLKFSTFVRKTHPTGVSNDIMGSAPHHPLYAQLIESLKASNRNFFVPYITVMFSTGPLFVSKIFRRYLRHHSGSGNDLDFVRILMPEAARSAGAVSVKDFFFTVQGSSWHQDDASSIMFMLHHWVAFLVFYVLLFFVLLGTAFWIELKLVEFGMALSRSAYKQFAQTSTMADMAYPEDRESLLEKADMV